MEAQTTYEKVFYQLLLVLWWIFSYPIFHILPDIFNYIEIRTLRWTRKCKDSIAFQKIACLSRFLAWSIVLLEEKGLVLIAIDFLDAFGEILL